MPPPRYPAYPYSAGQWTQPLPMYTYPHFPQPYPWGGYGSYPQQPHLTGGGYPLSPGRQKKKRRGSHNSSTPPPEIKIHSAIGGRYRPTAVWDVSQDLPTIRHLTDRGSLQTFPESMLSEPATEPPVQHMRIVSDAFSWDIKLALPRHEVITLGHVFGAIFGTLQESLEKEDWDEETPNAKRNMHKARCARLARGPATFKLDMHVKKIDTLGDKTFFMGMKPVGPPDEPSEWLLKLGPPPRQGRR